MNLQFKIYFSLYPLIALVMIVMDWTESSHGNGGIKKPGHKHPDFYLKCLDDNIHIASMKILHL